MGWLHELYRKLSVLFRRARFDRDLEEEMQFHLEMQAEENRANGILAEEAQHAARRQFGNAMLLKEMSRGVWGWGLVERLSQDTKFALRLLARNPGFSVAAVLTLALGIGVNSAIFTLVDACLFRAAPVENGERLVSLADKSARHTGWPISYPNFLDWKQQNQVFERMAAYRVGSFVITDETGAERVPGMEVSSAFFEILGMKPALGRSFLRSEHAAGAAPVALISYELWRGHFGGDPGIVGKTLGIGNERYAIVGVATPGFRIGPRAEVYVPIEREGAEQEGRGSANSLYAIARLKPGVTWEQAQGEMDMVAARLEKLYPETNRGHRVDLVRFGQLRREEMRPGLLILWCAVGLVLLIACANIAHLLLAKATGRGREVSIRKALGASRGQLIFQLLVESTVLAAIGGLVGSLFGYWSCQGLVAATGDLDRLPGGEPLGGIHVDARVFAFTMLVTLLTGLATGLAPAFQAARGELTTRANDRHSHKMGDLLVTVEVGLSLVLLSSAGLLIRSLDHLLTLDRGFEAKNVLTLSLARAGDVCSTREDCRKILEKAQEDCRRVLDEVQALPGVTADAAAFPLPYGHGFSGDFFQPEGRQDPGRGHYGDARIHYVSPGYFRTLGMRLLKGRWIVLTDEDRGAVVNETMARESWPGETPIGRRFRMGTPVPNSEWITVVGVAANTRENGLDARPVPEIYLVAFWATDILVRTAGDARSVVGAIRARIRSVNRNQAVFDIQLLEDRISDSIRGKRSLAWLLGIFAGMALVLAAVGIYGVVAHSVTRRTQELGVRMALGAEAGDVQFLVLRQGMRPVLFGVIWGIVGAYGSTQALRGFLFGVTPADPVTHASVALVLSAIALFACYLPARRATRIDPVEALRYE